MDDILWTVMQILDGNHARKDEIALGFRFGIKFVIYLSLNKGQFSEDLRNYLREERHSTNFNIERFISDIERLTRKGMPKDVVVLLRNFTYQKEMPEFVSAVLVIYEHMFESVALIRRWYLDDQQEEKLETYFTPILTLIDQVTKK